MSTPSESVVKTPERRSFSQTCSLLSRYLKENKVALGDLNLGGRPGTFNPTITPLNLFPENPIGDSIPKNQPAQSLKPMDLFPQFIDSSTRMSGAAEKHETVQMTILYAGQVTVFNDLPADKAKEIMLLASKVSNSQAFTPQTAFAAKIPNNQSDANATVPPSLNSSNLIQDGLQRRAMPIASSLPLARRSSLQRFLERRRDRILSRSANPIPAKAASFEPLENRSWPSSAATKSASSGPLENISWLSSAAAKSASSGAADSRSWLSLATRQ